MTRRQPLGRPFSVCVILFLLTGCAARSAQLHGRPLTMGEPQGPLISLSAAQSQIKWQIVVPSYAPSGVTLQGVLAAGIGPDSQQVRVHYSNGIVLLEGPSTIAPLPASGAETSTTVNGYPGAEIVGPMPHKQLDPVSQIRWWTGSMSYDLYGAVDFQEIREMADSMK